MSKAYYDPKDYDAVPIGNSGFEYTCHTDYNMNPTFTIRDNKTKATLFTLKGGSEWNGRGMHATRQSFSGNKTILGKDEKYYYISTNGGNHTLNWGIVQTSGIVLKTDRSILTTVDFHPLYDSRPEIKLIPSIKPIPKPIPVVIPKKEPVIAEVTTTSVSKIELKSLLDKLINWIERILNL